MDKPGADKSNHENVDKYNSYRYDNPTYLTVNSNEKPP